MVRTSSLFLLTTFLIPLPGAAQVPSEVGGTVLDATTLRPLAAAEILVEGTPSIALTNAAGRFHIGNLRGPRVTLRVSRIGYTSTTLETSVGATRLRILLSQSPVELDALVVTGTAGDARVRAIGNSVGRLDVAARMEIAPVDDLSGLLNNETPGVLINQGGGDVGAGGNIRVRGVSSLSLDNGPLVYIDGVRVNGGSSGFFYVGGIWNIDRLNDLDPSQIERVEVLKGPAAATLYGSEASNGVIQIITKKGQAGEARIGVTVEQGANFVPGAEGYFPSSYYEAADGSLQRFNFVAHESEIGRPFLRTGHRQRYAVDVSGGSDALTYFMTGSWEGDEGPFRSNGLDRLSGRLNVEASVTEDLRVSAGAGYVRSIVNPGSNANGSPMSCAFYPDPELIDTERRGCTAFPPEAYYEAYDRTQSANRFTGDVTAMWQPTRWLNARLLTGLDFVDQENVGLVQRLSEDLGQYFGNTARGLKDVQRNRTLKHSIDASTTAAFHPTETLASTTSVGLQIYKNSQEILTAHAEQFPILGIQSVSSAAVALAGEQFVENNTVGVYVQQQLAWKDRLFLTAAIRADDNSAFGTDFDLVTYPKVSAAWVVTEESFWPWEGIDMLRVRAAYGEAGRQPDAFSALRTYEPFIGRGDRPTVRPQFAGNPFLGPERGKEVELGFEASLLDDRVTFDFTYYDKKTEDAILLQNTIPSNGFPQSQYINVGQISNWGTEFMVKATPIEREGLQWNLSLNLSTAKDRIDELGDVDDIASNLRLRFREGYPVNGQFDKRVVDYTLTPDGGITDILCDSGPEAGGTPVPCSEAPRLYLGDDSPNTFGNVSTTLTLMNRLTVFGQVDFKRDYRVFSFTRLSRCHFLRRCEANFNAAVDPITAAEVQAGIWGHSALRDASFAKLRQISLTYRMPDGWAGRLGASAASITLSGRNLHTWTAFDEGDPEVQDILPLSLLNLQQGDLPHPTQILASIRLAF